MDGFHIFDGGLELDQKCEDCGHEFAHNEAYAMKDVGKQIYVEEYGFFEIANILCLQCIAFKEVGV